MKDLRSLIRFILESEEKKEDLLLEPDEIEGDEEQEASSGGVAGVSVPLGAGPHYPSRSPRKNGIRRRNVDIARLSFGGSEASHKK